MSNLKLSLSGLIAAVVLTGSSIAAAQAHQGVAKPQQQITYTCIAQVSFIQIYPETITPDGGFSPVAASSGTEPLGTKTVTNASACHAYTRQVYHQNNTWSHPTAVCAGLPNDSGNTVLVYATDYFQEIGNGNGVNRDDGFSTICNPTNTLVIHNTL
jgi:hypothetical protein